jgi:hypothetical protein
VIGYIDEDSPVRRISLESRDQTPFSREAEFVSTEQLVDALERAGFTAFEFVQTVYHLPDEVSGLDPVQEGDGDGSFVVIRVPRCGRFVD